MPVNLVIKVNTNAYRRLVNFLKVTYFCVSCSAGGSSWQII